MSFTFGAQPGASSLFGQTPGFGTQPQQPFGAATTAPTAAPQFGSTFGAGAPSTGLQFGNSTATPLFGQPQSGAFPLGAATSTPGNTFGTPGLFGAASVVPNTGLTFGAATSAAPAFGAGLTFGAPATSTPAFGAPTSSGQSFGFVGNTFAAPASSQNTGLTFGTPTATSSTGLRFGTPASTGLTFGTTPAAPTTGISFGNAPTLSAASTGLTFSTPATSVSTFGAPTNTGLSFGSTPIGTGLTFGTAAPFNSAATTTQNSGLTLGGTTSTPNLSIGTGGTTLNFTSAPAPATTGIAFAALAPTTGLNFVTQTAATTAAVPTASLTFSTASAIPNSGLLYGTPTSSAPTFGGTKSTGSLTFLTPTLSLGGTTTTGTSTALTFNTPFPTAFTSTTTSAPFSGLGFTTPSVATASVGLGGIPATKTTATTAPQQIGLGGVSTTTPKQTSTTAPQGELPPKDQPLPNELIQTVDLFKAFLKEQKASSSEIARFSMKELKTVEANITGVNNMINELENELQKNKCVGEKLKLDTAQALQYAEMAQRTFEIPAGMQYDNTAPINFFVHLLQDFERDLQQLRFHLEYINKQVKNGNSSSLALTPEDLALGLRRLHQTFVTLAGRLQTVHHQVEVQKERYLSLRKEVLNDTSNVFESQNKDLEALEYALKSIANTNKLPEVVAGPSPFNSLGTGQAQLLAQNPPPAYPGTSSLGQTTTGTYPLGPNTLFGTNLGNTSSLFNGAATATSFQLQKPPTGSKRGKT